MYCSSCGVALARDLSYCNHCGAQLGGARSEVPAELFPDSLIWAIVSVFVVGVGCIIGLTAVMKNYGLNDAVTMGFAATIFTLMLAIEGVFIALLLSRKKSAKRERDAEALDGRRQQQTTNELEAAQPKALPEHMASVTEHTTRAFEPVYRDRKTE